MKRFLIGISIFLISLFSFSAPAMAEGASLSISGGGAKKIGATFNLTASLNTGGNQICVVTFDITYPANLLTLNSSTLGSPFTMATEQSSSAGTIHYSVGAGGCTTSNATLLTMSFKAKAAGNATVAFSSGESIGGADGQQVIATGKGSTTVTMGATTTTNKNTNAVAPVVVPLKDPVLSKLEFSADATLDDVTKMAKGISFTGTADADAKINLVITSDPITASAQSDAAGNWTYTLVDWLPAGDHSLAMIAEKGTQKSTEVKTSFVVGTSGKDQIAIGTALPAAAVVAEPATETKSKMSITTMAMIGGGVVLVLAIVLIIIFMNKRRKYMKVAKEISNKTQMNSASPGKVNSEAGIVGSVAQTESSVVAPETTPVPTEAVPETNTQDQTASPQNQPMNMPKDIPTSDEPKMTETTPLQEMESNTASPRPLSTQIQNVKPDEGEMVIGYGAGSGTPLQSQSIDASPAKPMEVPPTQSVVTPEIPKPPVVPPVIPAPPAVPNKTPAKTDSTESEITFDQ